MDLKRVIRAHCGATIQRAVDSHAEHAALDEDDEDFTPFAPTFDDYRLWEASGVDWRVIRDRTEPTEGST